jgi:putative glycosyltransferase (TIGR04348 family)
VRILLITPAPPRSRHGNRVTALRWLRILRGLGHRVTLAQTYRDQPCDLLIALHARRSHDAVRRFRALHPHRPLIVALTGTDLHHDLARSARARRSLELATLLVTLQPLAIRQVPARQRAKVRVILQSGAAAGARVKPAPGFQVCVVGHLRREKDPLRTALAVRRLPSASALRVVHAGKALAPHWQTRALRETRSNPRYRWVGALGPAAVARLMGRSRAMVLSSRMEGGANVVTEAVVRGLPVLASRIPGSVGLLGARYLGYFPVGDTQALRRLLLRVEAQPALLERLRRQVDALAPRFRPAREREAWRRVLRECRRGDGTRRAAEG